MGKLVGKHVLDPTVTAAQIEVLIGSPDINRVRVVVGGAVAQHIGAVDHDDVNRRKLVIVVVGGRKRRKNLLGDVCYSARRPGGATHIVNAKMVRDDRLNLRFSRFGLEPQGKNQQSEDSARTHIGEFQRDFLC